LKRVYTAPHIRGGDGARLNAYTRYGFGKINGQCFINGGIILFQNEQ